MRFDLTDLRLFLHIAESASITGGAERSNMALASASARIRGMETALGAPLLDRGRRGVSLTPAGRALVHHARLVLQQVERMRGDLGDFALGLKGQIRLMSNTSAITEFLPKALADFLIAHPHVDIDLEERPSYEVVRAVASGMIDAGVIADIADLSAVESFPLRDDNLVLVVPRGHPLSGQRKIAFREIVDQAFVGLSHGSALQQHLALNAERHGRHLALRVRLSGLDGVCPYGRARRRHRRRSRNGRSSLSPLDAIKTIPLSDAWAKRRLVVCVRRLHALPTHARQLVDHLRTA